MTTEEKVKRYDPRAKAQKSCGGHVIVGTHGVLAQGRTVASAWKTALTFLKATRGQMPEAEPAFGGKR